MWALAIAAWLIAGIVAPLSTDNRPRLESGVTGYVKHHETHATCRETANYEGSQTIRP